jgi:hypothetical protein
MAAVQNQYLTRLRAFELRSRLNGGGLTVGLGKVDIPVNADLELAAITQADFSGYAPRVIGPDDWSAPGLTGLGEYSIQSTVYQWTNGGADQTVYLWCIHNGAQVLVAERWADGVVIEAGATWPLAITLAVRGEVVIS